MELSLVLRQAAVLSLISTRSSHLLVVCETGSGRRSGYFPLLGKLGGPLPALGAIWGALYALIAIPKGEGSPYQKGTVLHTKRGGAA